MPDDTPEVTEAEQDGEEETPEPEVTYEQVTAGAPDGTEMLDSPAGPLPDVEPERVDAVHRPEQPVDAIADAPEVPKREFVKPRLVDIETYKANARAAQTVEKRLKTAKPFPLETLECEVMVAPTRGMKFYEKLFGGRDALFASGADVEEPDVDFAFIKEFIISCVVQPVLDDEALELTMDANAAEFSALAAFCMGITQIDPNTAIMARLGQLDTSALEIFSGAVGGSTS